MCKLHQINVMFVYVASVNIVHIFHTELLIYVDNIVILWDV